MGKVIVQESTKFETDLRRVVDGLGGFPWLRKGDSILLKVSCNSGDSYPWTTSPELLETVARLLKESGAGRLVVGEESGLEWVHKGNHKPTFFDYRKNRTTAHLLRKNGLLQAAHAAGCEIVLYEQTDYDQAFFKSYPEVDKPGWKDGVMVPTLLKEVDHILYLPRVCTHVLGGATLGLKIAVGFLREDSRWELHNFAKSFMCKCAEINAIPEIKDKLRMIISDVYKVGTTFGPDKMLLGYEAEMNPRLIIGSTNIVSHDVVAFTLLMYAREHLTPWYRQFDLFPRCSNGLNWMLVTLTSSLAGDFNRLRSYDGYCPMKRGTPYENEMIRRGAEIFGDADPELILEGSGLPNRMKEFLCSGGKGDPFQKNSGPAAFGER
jgi:uncharacterized protein (DUF362 family)